MMISIENSYIFVKHIILAKLNNDIKKFKQMFKIYMVFNIFVFVCLIPLN